MHVLNQKISTSKLNAWLIDAQNEHQPPLLARGARLRMKYMTQIGARPPTFKIFSNHPDKISDSYEKYLMNSLCMVFNFNSVPVRFKWQKTNNPYHRSKK
jgi:GTP-binding protein